MADKALNAPATLIDELALRPGTSLYNGMYRIEKVLGRGGFGITYQAAFGNIGKSVAIKEFFPKGMCDRDYGATSVSVASRDNVEIVNGLKEKFVKEAKRLASLSHDSIVEIRDVFVENETAYYVMGYIKDSIDLKRKVEDEGPMCVERALVYIRQVGEALEYIHSLNIIHLDVKPANILVNPVNDRCVLIDFDLSKHYDEKGKQTTVAPVGISDGYAPMEQYQTGGVSTFSATSDVYSLAATLFYMLTARKPPEAPCMDKEVMVFPVQIPIHIQNAIVKAMSRPQVDRYQTVGDFLQALYINTDDSKTRLVNESGISPKVIQNESDENDLRDKAELGDVTSQKGLGDIFYYGRGVAQNYAEAVKWYKKAAQQGEASSQNKLGYMYENGYGVEQNYDEAMNWYSKAAEQGVAAAQNNIGELFYYGRGVKRNYAMALRWYRKAAEQGYASAQINLGFMYDEGISVWNNYPEAVKWYRKAAEQGNSLALNNLGVMYDYGRGVKQDIDKAIKLYRTAADQGLSSAEYNLGMLYKKGRGVKRDYKEAERWLEKAALQGDEAAINELHKLKKNRKIR